MSFRALSRPAVAFRLALLLTILVGAAIGTQAERLPIKTYTTADGLASDGVNRIVRDSRGFLWFCTSDGLSRFDGYKFTNYGVDQGLPDRQVNDFLETRGGVYWVATAGGLCRFDPSASTPSGHADSARLEPRFVIYHLGDNERSDRGAPRYQRSQAVYALCEDSDGALWCGAERSLYRIGQDKGKWVFTQIDLGPPTTFGSANAFSVLADRRGAVWVLAGSGLYRRRSDGIVERYTSLEGLYLTDHSSLFEDREGNIWLGTGVALHRLVPEPAPGHSVVARLYSKKDGLAQSGVSCIFQSSDGRLWIGTWDSLNELLPAAEKGGRQFRSYTSANGIIDVKSLAEDRDGSLWMGTETNGAMKIAANGFTTYGDADGLGGNRVGGISEDRSGALCVFSAAKGKGFVSRFDGGTFSAVELALPKGITQWSWGWYQNMFEDSKGEWWMSTFQGLVRYPRLTRLSQLTHAAPKAIYTTRDGLSGNDLFRIFEDSRGDVWAGTVDLSASSLSRWQRSSGAFRRYSQEDGIPPVAPTAFCEDASGSVWIGFYNGGVARYREGRFTFFSSESGLPSGFVRALLLDHAGRLWIATGDGGVARVDDPTAEQPQFVTYTTAEGLSSNHATCVTEDQSGRIYIGTGRGVDQLDPSTGHIKHYTTADGLANNSVNVSFRDRSGALWFGTLDGLSRFIPEPDRPGLPPSIFIGGLRIAGVRQAISQLGESAVAGLTLQAAQNQLQIDFFGLAFGPGEALRYRYKLEGADKDWSPLTDQRSVDYPNLSPGTYHFLVQAVSADGLVSRSPAGVAFTILPPIWQRWWFVALAALLVGLITYSLYRYRVSRLIELERVRTRIATDLHDEIGSSLSQIAILSEVATKRIESRDGAAMTPLARIAYLSRESVDAMSDIVWAINPHKDRLSDLTHRMRRLANEVLTARDIELRFTAPGDDQDTRIDVETRRQVFLIFKEAINNIVRHSGCTEAEIDFHLSRARLVLAMSDNGCGFDPELTQDGHGLKSLRDRAEALGGRLEVVSGDRMGTTVTLNIPHHK